MDKIKNKLIEGYKHIYGLNNFNLIDHQKFFFKYMPLDRFLQSVENKELVFVSPSTWYDPFERLYFNADCRRHHYQTDEIACMCITSERIANEEAAWRIYSDNGTQSVRLSIDILKLFDLLEEYADNNKCTVYIGSVNYTLNKSEIKDLAKVKSPYHAIFCPPLMKKEHYLSLMLLKRPSFAYENEVRIFIVKRDNLYQGNEKRLLRIDCDYQNRHLYSKVDLSPYSTVSKSTAKGKIYAKLHDLESKALKQQIKGLLGYACKVEQSHLYDEIKPCVID